MIRHTLALSLPLCALLAQEAHRLESMTVTTATRSEANLESLSASVVVIDQNQIAQSGASDLKGVLQSVPGILLQYNAFPSASAASKASISIRGVPAGGTLMLIDGRRLAGEVKNPFDLERIPAASIERIEIVKGPMSTLYGADALGGVINIITQKPKPGLGGSVQLQGGDADGATDSALAVSLQGKNDFAAFSLHGSLLATDPFYRDETADVYAKAGTNKLKPSMHPHPQLSANLKDSYDARTSYREEADVTNLGVRVEKSFGDTLVGLDADYMDEERTGEYVAYFHPTGYQMGTNFIPAYNVPVKSIDENRRVAYGLDVKTLLGESTDLSLRAYVSDYEKRNKTGAIHYADMGYAGYADSEQTAMNADVLVRGYEGVVNMAAGESHLVTAGAEYRTEDRDATVFTQTNEMTRKSVEYKALSVQDEYALSEKTDLIFGGRYDDISNADSKPTFRVGAAHRLNAAWSLKANLAQGYRAPDLRELFIYKQTPQGLNQGSEVVGYDLEPESINSFDLALGGKFDKLNFTAGIFANQISDRIGEVVKTGNIRTFENTGDATTQGFEAELKAFLADGLELAAGYTQIQSEEEKSGQDLVYTPNQSAFLGLSFAAGDLKTSLSARHTGTQEYDAYDPITDTVTRKEADAYTLTDLRVAYAMTQKGSELFAGVKNLLDEKVDDAVGSDIGRRVYGGVRMAF